MVRTLKEAQWARRRMAWAKARVCGGTAGPVPARTGCVTPSRSLARSVLGSPRLCGGDDWRRIGRMRELTRGRPFAPGARRPPPRGERGGGATCASGRHTPRMPSCTRGSLLGLGSLLEREGEG